MKCPIYLKYHDMSSIYLDMFPRRSLARSPSHLEEDARSELQQDLQFSNSQLKQEISSLKVGVRNDLAIAFICIVYKKK